VAISCHGSFAAGLPRIASMNVCSDSVLLSLADPAQIVASAASRAMSGSPGRRRCAALSGVVGCAEDVLVAKAGHRLASLSTTHRRASS